MQILASKKVYMFFYGAIGIIKVSAELQIFAKLCGQNSKIVIFILLFVLVLVVPRARIKY